MEKIDQPLVGFVVKVVRRLTDICQITLKLFNYSIRTTYWFVYNGTFPSKEFFYIINKNHCLPYKRLHCDCPIVVFKTILESLSGELYRNFAVHYPEGWFYTCTGGTLHHHCFTVLKYSKYGEKFPYCNSCVFSYACLLSPCLEGRWLVIFSYLEMQYLFSFLSLKIYV